MFHNFKDSSQRGILMMRYFSVINVKRFSDSTSQTVANKFAKKRTEYQNELTVLRRKWQEEFNQKKKIESDQKQAEKERIILEKAIRLREKRKLSAQRQELARQSREAALKRYKSHLAHNLVVREEHEKKQTQMYSRAIEDLAEESSTWIRNDNIDSKITEDLFATPTTTGLVTKYSQFWHYQVFTPDLTRLMSPEVMDAHSVTSLEDRMKFKGESRLTKKLMVEDFLGQMIGSGKEREEFSELVDQFSKQFEKMEAFSDVDKYYDYLLDSQNEEENGESIGKGPLPVDDIEEVEEEEGSDETASELSDDVVVKKI